MNAWTYCRSNSVTPLPLCSPMSQSKGKITRDRKRRISAPVPYEIPPKTLAGMPTTRHSPARASNTAQSAQATADPPMSEVLRELTLLRQSMETKFLESGAKVDNLKTEVLAKLEDNDQAIAELQETVTEVTLSVDRNQRAIQEVRAEVEKREVELPLRVKKIVQEALAGSRPTRGETRGETRGQKPRPWGRTHEETEDTHDQADHQTNPDAKKPEDYARARRSLRLWPVSREGDLRERTVEFLINELLLDQQHAVGLDFEVKRVGRTNGANARSVKDEVLVVFASARARDDVRSFAKNLERRGRGLRLEIPDHLWPSFRVLQKVAYELKQKNQDMKRNILFDDDKFDLKLDVCVNSEWRTIYPEGARQSLAKMGKSVNSGREALADSELDGLLATGDSCMESEEY